MLITLIIGHLQGGHLKTIQLRTISRLFTIYTFQICKRGSFSESDVLYAHLRNYRNIKCRMVSMQHFINEATGLLSRDIVAPLLV